MRDGDNGDGVIRGPQLKTLAFFCQITTLSSASCVIHDTFVAGLILFHHSPFARSGKTSLLFPNNSRTFPIHAEVSFFTVLPGT